MPLYHFDAPGVPNSVVTWLLLIQISWGGLLVFLEDFSLEISPTFYKTGVCLSNQNFSCGEAVGKKAPLNLLMTTEA